MFFMSVYIINIKKSSGTRENIFKNGTGLILYIIIKLEQYLIIIPKLWFDLLLSMYCIKVKDLIEEDELLLHLVINISYNLSATW